MNTLNKHKKKGLEGFKKFVCSLEGMADKTRLKVVQVAILEDPVYLMAAMSNLINFEYLFKFDGEEKQKIFNSVPGGIKTLLFAIKGHPREVEFINDLDSKTVTQYKDESEYFTPPSFGQTLTAQKSFVEAMRKLQEGFAIKSFEWKLPSDGVINGLAFSSASSNGTFILKYDSGIVALEGELEKKIRIGEWKHYYPNGTIMAEGVYISNEKAGPWTFYYSNENVKAKGEFRENLKEGEWEEYDKNGEMFQVNYKRGKCDF